MTNGEADCVFCRIFGLPSGRRWHDEVLLQRDGFSVLPGIGPQAEGYVLIVADDHVVSCAELGRAKLQLLDGLRRQVRHVLNQVYGPCIFFEHGSTMNGARAGAAISHLHVHSLPTRAPVLDFARRAHRFIGVTGLDGLTAWRGRPYLAMHDQNDRLFVASGEGVRSQQLRRIVAEAIGSPGEWDYRAYPQKARIRATIRTLAPLFASVTIEGPEAATAGDTRPRIFIARAIDYRGTDVAAEGASLAESVRAAGYVPVDPVVDLLPQHWGRRGTTWYGSGGGRVDSNLEWLRRCDAMVVDMSLQDWTYIGCVCEIVYAFLWRIPTVVIAGRTTLEREWLRYHTTRRVDDVPDAIEELKGLLGGT